MMRLRPAVAGLAMLACLAATAGKAQQAESIDFSTSAISNFRIGSSQTRFGPLEFVSGFEIASRDRRFGGISGFRFLEPGGAFLAISDTGRWITGTIARDGDGVPTGLDGLSVQAMETGGQALSDDPDIRDAEGLAIAADRAIVSFERQHRVEAYALQPEAMGGPVEEIDFLIPRAELRNNAGLETIVATDPAGEHGGALIVVAERSIDRDGNIFAAILGGPHRGIFKVARTDEFDVTDGAMLPGGDLLLLERSFAFTRGVAMRLRRIPAAELRAGSLARGEGLFSANMTFRIDNMEGLDVWQRADGATMVSIVSDDNQSFLQRTLYLEFVLTDD